MKKLAFVSLLLVTAFGAFAQDWASSYQESVDLYNNFQSKEARASAEKALAQIKADQGKATANHAVILRQLSLICYDLGDLAAALSYAKEEVEMLISLGANQDMNYANALQNLAVIRMDRSEYGPAETLLTEALNMTLAFNSEESYEVAVAKGNLAIAKFQLQKDQEARELFAEAIEVMNTFDEVGSEYYRISYNYGALLMEAGDLNSALPLFQELEAFYNYDTPNFEYGGILIKVADVMDQLGQFQPAVAKYRTALDNFREMGEEQSEEYAIALNNLGIDLQKIGEFSEAQEIFEELMRQKQASGQVNDISYANTLTNYANLLLRKGESTSAKEQLEKVDSLYGSQNWKKDRTYVSMTETLSGILLSEGNSKEGLVRIDEGIEIAEMEGYKQLLYALYNQKAKILTQEAKYEEARILSEKALKEAEVTYGTTALQTAFVLNTCAGVYAQLGIYDRAEKSYLRSLPIFRSTYGEAHPEYATVAANYSSLLQLQGNYYTAEYYLKIAEEIKRNTFGKENRDYLITYENLGLLYLNTASYTDAAKILEEIKEIKERILDQDDPSLAYTLSNLGSVKKQLADYAESENYLKKARDIYKTTVGTSHIFYGGVINNLALLYQKMGNLDAAKPLFQESLKIYENSIGKLNPDYATALENLATLYQMQGEYAKAKELLEEALTIDEQILGTDHPLYSKTLHNLASLYEENGEYVKSKELYLKALEIDSKVFGEQHPSYASTLYNLATLEQELEDYDQALLHFQKVVEIRKNSLGVNHPDYAYALYGLASIKHKTGDFEGARPLYIEVTEKYLASIQEYFPALSESEKSALYAKIKPVFDNYFDYVIDFNLLNKGTETDRQDLLKSIYNLQLNTKALLLNASNKVRNLILTSGDSDLIGLFSDWTALKENIVKAYAMSTDELRRNEIDISQMEAKSNDLEKQLSLKSSAFAGEFEKQKVTWLDVTEHLEPNETAMEIIRIKKKMKIDSVLYVALILNKDSDAPKLVVNASGIGMEEKGFKSYKNLIIYKVEDSRSYALFWKAFDKIIPPETATLFLSADGVLNKVNIATLFDPEKKEYLVDRYKVRLLSNTRELVTLSDQISALKDAEVFGFPAFNLGTQPPNSEGALFSTADMKSSFGNKISELPGTLDEVNNIEKIVGGGTITFNKYTARRATEDQLKALSSPNILHIATHGFFLEDLKSEETEEASLSSRNGKFNPLLRSGLLFAGAENTVNFQTIPGTEDGILTAYEAMNLNLDQTQLVVMSACETGLGEVKNGEGVYGLQRSFLVAGADNLIMSLWKVNDETTQMLMSSFYKSWFDGNSRLDAFNQAIAEVRKKYKEPYYWGAFVMLGK